MTEELFERYELVEERLANISAEDCPTKYSKYFKEISEFVSLIDEIVKMQESGKLASASLEELKALQVKTYGRLDAKTYDKSFLNPTYAKEQFGEIGGRLSLVYADSLAMIPWAYEGRHDHIVIFMELLSQVYTLIVDAFDEEEIESELNDAIYWFYHDYNEIFAEDTVSAVVDPTFDFFKRIIREEDLTNPRYLYLTGAYVGENEEKLVWHFNTMSEEEIQSMADTFTNGYVKGFEMSRRDIKKKKSVRLEYQLGLERMMKKAMANFEAIGLESVVSREAVLSSTGRTNRGRGVYATSINPQFVYDHKDDRAYYFDRGYGNRRIEAYQVAFEERKQMALTHGGPAVVDMFGEVDFEPKNFEANAKYTDEQNALNVEFAGKSGEITNRYIPGEERSFTIIAYPLPSIGDDFKEIFNETVRINNLDYQQYQDMQQKIIDVLDMGNTAIVKGCGANETDLRVELCPIEDKNTQSHFENCVADVNIPVGEVFTSPVLTGTCGVLHVSQVYLNGLSFKELKITFEDGKIKDYTCKNFDNEEENRKLIYENILFRHDTLPLGEFAIGTNTTAYKMGRDFDIAAKLPILIAEKTGPHFAVGDTCYSHSEEVAMFNPDGKEVIARENECSRLRNTDVSKAYFNCHTDITIPFDELGAISVITTEGDTVDIIRDGRFVIPGCEALNVPLDEMEAAK